MKAGSKVLCIDAHEKGIPITEGETYTLTCAPYRVDDCDIPEVAHIKAVRLAEVPGQFMVTRFQEVSE